MSAKTSVSSEANPQIVTSEKPAHNRKGFKFPATLGLVVLLLVALAITAFLLWTKPSTLSTDQCSRSSRQTMLRQAAPLLFNPAKQAQLKLIVSQIQQLSNYQLDPNCDAVLMAYYVNAYDGPNAQKSLNWFNQAYSPHKGLSSTLNINSSELQALIANVTLVQKQSAIINTVLEPMSR